jgi:hypothetical protein
MAMRRACLLYIGLCFGLYHLPMPVVDRQSQLEPEHWRFGGTGDIGWVARISVCHQSRRDELRWGSISFMAPRMLLKGILGLTMNASASETKINKVL